MRFVPLRSPRKKTRRNFVALASPRWREGYDDARGPKPEDIFDVGRARGMAWGAGKALEKSSVGDRQPLLLTLPAKGAAQSARIIGQNRPGLWFDQSDGLVTGYLPPRCRRAEQAENGLRAGVQEGLEIFLGGPRTKTSSPLQWGFDSDILGLLVHEVAESDLGPGSSQVERFQCGFGRRRLMYAHERARSQVNSDTPPPGYRKSKDIQNITGLGCSTGDRCRPHNLRSWRIRPRKWGMVARW